MKSKTYRAALAAVAAADEGGGGDDGEVAGAMMEAEIEANMEAVAEIGMEDDAAGEEGTQASVPTGIRNPKESETKTGHWMNYVYSNEPTINDNELISLTALIAYVAHITRQNEFRIERQFADRFNIPNVKCLPIDRYNDAVRYLVDQVPLFAA
jgi:hypothetical protein